MAANTTSLAENNIPEIIGEAAKSPLGILALMVIALSLIGFLFFHRESRNVRLVVFAMLFTGFAAFGVAIVRQWPMEKKPDNFNPTPTPTPTPGPVTPTPTAATPTPVPVPSPKMTISIDVKSVRSFIEFKMESEQTGEMKTGRITTPGQHISTWDMRSTSQRIWFWWDTLDGEADLTISAGNVVLFKGHCAHYGDGEVKVLATCPSPETYKDSGLPKLVETSKPDTVIEFNAR